ncbi:flagellar biosynthesis protein FlhA [Sphingomonas sp. 1P06PA]|uniref:FHIPEP family type III secretion protein n=1 Tax=Sphingomonas sp. 1P06PA TaxID=554121 RepID=UPI0039A64D30
MTIQRYIASAEAPNRIRLSARFADLALVAGVVAIVALMILPLPTFLIDLLVAVNITFGVMLLLTTLYIRTALDFSSFPSVLLVSTLFRLALSIATTRMILIEAHGGHIIQTFGQMVAGGNLVVGLVVFLIITIVQFIVIAKGAERVAEVAARFSLDSMPGKQLSIDSDLRSGLIDKDEARRRRRVLEQESKLHGSLDGAMKFVKGDAIASIVIVVINLLGGLAIGVMQRDMSLGDATHTYSILTIGEGLVAQIPALLGAMAAGLIVTRATDEEDSANLGEAIHRQLSANPRVLLFVGGIALLMAFVPGFPTLIFIMLGLAAIAAGASMHPRFSRHVARALGPVGQLSRRGREPEAPATLIAAPAEPRPVVPLLLELRSDAHGAATSRALSEGLTRMLDDLQYRTGLPFPKLAIHFDRGEGAPRWRLLAFESAIGAGDVPADQDDLIALIEGALRRHVAMFLGVQEVTALLNKVGADYPEVVKEAVRAVPTARITDVLRRLAEEEVPLRNMRDVLEALTEAGTQEREPAKIADLSRVALKRYLLAAYAEDEQLRALVMGPDLEDLLRGAIRDGGERLALEPEVADALVATIRGSVEQSGARVLIASIDIRRALRKLIERDLFELPVLAFNELSARVRLDVVGKISLPPAPVDEQAQAAIAAE